MSDAVHAAGTTLTWDNEVVAKLKNIGGVELNVDMIDVTTHDSTSYYKQFVAGFIDTGEIPCEGLFDAGDTAGQQAMVTDCAARASKTAVITFPTVTGTTWTFTGFITKIKIGDNPIDGAIPFTCTIKPTGVPVLSVSLVTGMSACGFSNDVLMMPAFGIAAFEYVVTITNGQTTTVITPVDASGGEIITITANGASQVVTTGNPSTAIAVSAVAITDIVIVISHATKASKTYTFHCAVLAA